MKIKKKLLCSALVAVIATGFSGYLLAEPEGSLERFKARIAAIEALYPEAQKEIVPEIGKNVLSEEGVQKVEMEPNVPLQDGQKLPTVQKIVNLGISSMRAVAGEDGPILYIADNGRFVIAGRMIDVWQQKELKTIDEIENAVSRVYLDAMGYEQTVYSAIKLGSGAKRSVIFVDPHCGWCHKLISLIKEDEKLRNEYTFIFHPIPVLGAVSQPYAKKLWCSVAKDEEKLRAMLAGDEAVNSLSAQAECDTDAHDRSIYLSKLIGVKGVPFVIAPDGRISQGMPTDLRAFLSGEMPSQQ